MATANQLRPCAVCASIAATAARRPLPSNSSSFSSTAVPRRYNSSAAARVASPPDARTSRPRDPPPHAGRAPGFAPGGLGGRSRAGDFGSRETKPFELPRGGGAGAYGFPDRRANDAWDRRGADRRRDDPFGRPQDRRGPRSGPASAAASAPTRTSSRFNAAPEAPKDPFRTSRPRWGASEDVASDHPYASTDPSASAARSRNRLEARRLDQEKRLRRATKEKPQVVLSQAALEKKAKKAAELASGTAAERESREREKQARQLAIPSVIRIAQMAQLTGQKLRASHRPLSPPPLTCPG